MKQLFANLVKKYRERKLDRSLSAAASAGTVGEMLASHQDEMMHRHPCGHTKESHFVGEMLINFAEAQGIRLETFIAACRSVSDIQHWGLPIIQAMAEYDAINNTHHHKPSATFIAPAAPGLQ